MKILANCGLALYAIWVTAVIGLWLQTSERQRERAILQREDAIGEVRVLSGLLPICSTCKSIRDDFGAWTKLEAYISEHSEAGFTHGLCEPCKQELYSELKTDT